MKKKECLAFYKERFGKGVNIGGGDWEFTAKKEGENGFFTITVRLLKSPPIQHIENVVYYSPSWFVEVVREIREDNLLGNLMRANHREIPKGGEVLEEHLETALVEAYKLYEEIKQPKVISAYLTEKYNFGPSIGPAYKMLFFYCCVFKGDVELLEAERLAQEDGTTTLPPAYTLQFFTNAVRIAKEFRSGERVCPIDF
jgi:hypothetical protein